MEHPTPGSKPPRSRKPNAEVTEDRRVTIRHGHILLYLRTPTERKNPSLEDRALLSTWYAAGTAKRARQLEYLLDPTQARFGFTDENTTCSPNDIVGRKKIKYTLSIFQARTKFKAQGFQVEMDENLEEVDRAFAEAFEWSWQDFEERLERAAEDESYEE